MDQLRAFSRWTGCSSGS